ncbi:MAG: hypothetical protein AAFV26_01545 [Pseudomonadota bacterium]
MTMVRGVTPNVRWVARDFLIAVAATIFFAIILSFGAEEPVPLPVLGLLLPDSSIAVLLDIPRQALGQAVGPLPASLAGAQTWVADTLVTSLALLFAAAIAAGLAVVRQLRRRHSAR